MAEEVILQFMAQDSISPVVSMIQNNVVGAMQGIQSTMNNMGTAFNNTSLSFNKINDAQNVYIGTSKNATNTTKTNTDTVKNNTGAKRDNTTETRNNTQSTQDNASAWQTHTDIANMSAGSLMYLSGQMSTLGTKAEQSAKNLNDLKINMDQVAKMSGTSESDMADMITYMSNETFSNDEAVMYTKNLAQMGVESKNFVKSATDIDKINDAFGLGAETTNSLATELSVLGVDMNDISGAFNALAYANENTKGGMENFYSFLRKYDAELNELGYDTDQSAIIISAATQKFGGGRAALTGLSNALKEAGSDTSALESALNLKSGALQHASEETASYEGQLQNLADEEKEHKTILERMGAWVDDIKLKYASWFTMAESGMGVFGKIGSMALYGNAIMEMGKAFSSWSKADGIIMNTINRLRMFGKVQKEAQLVSSVTPASASMMASGSIPVQDFSKSTPKGVGKNMGKTAKETSQVVKGASATGALSAEANAAGTSMKATSTGLKGIGSGAMSMVAPLLQISIAIMIILPVLALIAAEALVLLKGLQLLIKALGFDKIDLSKSIEGIKQIGSALWEMGKAMGALTFASLMTAITMFTTGILQLANPIGVAGQALVNVAQQLQIFNGVNIDKSIPEKIKSISDGMKLVSDAMSQLLKITVDMAWGNLISRVLGNVGDAIRHAREDIINAGNEIAKIKDVPNLDEGATEKLQKIGSALESMGKAMDGLRSIRDSQNFDISGWVGGLFDGQNISEALESVKQDVYDASTALKDFDGVDTIPENVGNNLKKVSDSLKSVGDSISALRKLRDDYNWDEGIGSWFQDSDITTSLDNIKQDLVTVSKSLASLGDEKTGLDTIGEDIPDKIKKVTDTLNSVLGAVDNMEKFKGKGQGENGDDFSGVVTTIDNARSSLIEVSKSLALLGGSADGKSEGLSNIGEDISAKINAVNKTVKSLYNATTQLQSFPQVDGPNLGYKIARAVTGVNRASAQLQKLNPYNEGSGATTVASVARVSGRLRNAIVLLDGFPQVNGPNIGFKVARAVTGINRAVAQLQKITGTVPASVGTTVNSVNKISNRLKTAAIRLNSFPQVNGPNMGFKIGRAVTGVKRAITELNKLKGGDSVDSGIGGVLSAVSNAVKKLRTTLNEISPSFKTSGSNIGSNLKSGIHTGLNGLGDVVSGAVSDATSRGSATATSSGASMGTSMITGFKASFLLADVISAEMSAGLTAITTSTPDLTNAMGVLAQQMVTEFKSKGGIASPGYVARAIRDEMVYGADFVNTRGREVIASVSNLASNMVANFNPNLQSSLDNITSNLRTNNLNTGRVEALMNMRNNAPNGDNNHSNPVNIIISEGAIQLDARSLTVQESKQVLINALEGLDIIKRIEVRGV